MIEERENGINVHVDDDMLPIKCVVRKIAKMTPTLATIDENTMVDEDSEWLPHEPPEAESSGPNWKYDGFDEDMDGLGLGDLRRRHGFIA